MSCPRHRYGQGAEAHEDHTHPAHDDSSGSQPAHSQGTQPRGTRQARPADESTAPSKGSVRLS
jgi:hypothetical protein